jgi:hypothetical protein
MTPSLSVSAWAREEGGGGEDKEARVIGNGTNKPEQDDNFDV